MPKAKTKFYKYRQNNSGGHFHIEDEDGIGPRVWIEAVDASHADDLARSIGIYFNGVRDGMDCGCCGNRWSETWGDGSVSPEINEEYDFLWHDTVYVHHLSGKIKRIKAKKTASVES